MKQKRPLWQTIFTLFSLLLWQYQFLFIAPTTVSACSCMELNEQERFNSATAVFQAHVLEIKEPSLGGRTRLIVLELSRSWKGVAEDHIVLETGMDDGDCGYGFNVGDEYIVYAHQYENKWSTSICSGTMSAAVSGAQDIIDQLNKRPILKLTTVVEPTVGVSNLPIYIALGMIFLGGGFFFMRQRMNMSDSDSS